MCLPYVILEWSRQTYEQDPESQLIKYKSHTHLLYTDSSRLHAVLWTGQLDMINDNASGKCS